MAIENEDTEVKDAEVESEEEETEESPDSSQEGDADESESEEDEEDGEEEAPAASKVAPAAKKEIETPSDHGGIKRLPEETDREYAQRLEIKNLRDKLNGNRGREILDNGKPETAKQAKKAPSEVLKKYKPEDIQALREVLPELASEMGYVRKDELAASNYDTVAQEQVDAFVAAHPEYSSEKDPEGILWAKVRDEYKTFYKPPTNPKDLKKILERVHRDVFGIQAKGPLSPKEIAAKEKIKVASHSGSSAPAAPRAGARKAASGGFRFDALKGFSDEDIKNMEARASE